MSEKDLSQQKKEAAEKAKEAAIKAADNLIFRSTFTNSSGFFK